MKSSSLVSTFLFAGQLVLAAPRPAPKEASTGLQDGPLQHGGYHRVEKRKKLCSKLTSIDDSKPELAKLQWDESGAGDIGDDFIDANGAENWVRRLDEQIFDKQGNSPFHCLSWGGGCDYVKDCSKLSPPFYSFRALRRLQDGRMPCQRRRYRVTSNSNSFQQ